MKIALIVEGKTERAFLPHLRTFLKTRLAGRMPKLDALPCDGRIPTGDKLRRVVERLLDGRAPADAVIALTDVYTGAQPPDFDDAADARGKMRGWVGGSDKFYPHAAQFDFEAWLLPFWPKIQRLAGSNRVCPVSAPESVNHMNPPAKCLKDVFRSGSAGRAYVKTRDASRILRGEDLLVAAAECPELKSLLNTILRLCGGEALP